MLSLLKAEEDVRAKRLVKHEDIFNRPSASSTPKKRRAATGSPP